MNISLRLMRNENKSGEIQEWWTVNQTELGPIDKRKPQYKYDEGLEVYIFSDQVSPPSLGFLAGYGWVVFDASYFGVSVKCMFTFDIQSIRNKMFPSFNPLSRIMGLYASVVLVIGKFVREFFSGISHTIMFEELPNVDRILKLCTDIFLVRETGELDLEEDMYSKLIFLYRSPETMIKWTREKTQWNSWRGRRDDLWWRVEAFVLFFFSFFLFVQRRWVVALSARAAVSAHLPAEGAQTIGGPTLSSSTELWWQWHVKTLHKLVFFTLKWWKTTRHSRINNNWAQNLPVLCLSCKTWLSPIEELSERRWRNLLGRLKLDF